MQIVLMKHLNCSLIEINQMISSEFDFYYEKIIYDIKSKQQKNNNRNNLINAGYINS